MAWSAPQTWVPGLVHSAEMNLELRDNMLEQAAQLAILSRPNRLVVSSGLNSIDIREWKQATVDTAGVGETTTSTTFTDLATVGPSVNISSGTRAMVWITCQVTNNTVNKEAYASWGVSGATTSAAIDARSIIHQPATAGRYIRTTVCSIIALTAGTNIFTMKYRTDATGGTASFTRRSIVVAGLS